MVSGLVVAAVVSLAGPVALSVRAQDEDGLFTLAIVAANCEREPTTYPFRGGDCVPAEGTVITATTVDGDPVGSCVAEGVGGDGVIATCTIPVPYGSSLVVTEDLSGVPAGYAPRSNPQLYDVPTEPSTGLLPQPVFLNLPTGEAEAGTLTIYAAECPAGYAGDASADECDDNPAAGAPFRIGRAFSEAFSDYHPTDDGGLVAFEIGGLPLDGSLRVIEQLPPGIERFVAYCVDGAGSPLGITYPDDVGNSDLGVADVAVGETGDVACDWYNVPEAAGSEDEEEDAPASARADADDTGSGAGRPVAIYPGTCDDLGPRPSFALRGAAAAEGEAEGPAVATPAETSTTVVNVPVGDLLTEDHAVVVLAAHADARPGEAAEVAACGEIGGVRGANAPLAVGLRERDGSGVAGIASLSPDQADDDRTRVSVFVAPLLGEAEED